MRNKARVRKYAPELLEASKAALRLLLNQGSGVFDREFHSVTKKLREVIDLADPSFENEFSIRMVVSPISAETILTTLKQRAEENEEDLRLLEAVQSGIRYTKQRVFITLDIDHEILRRLRYVLIHTNAGNNQNMVFTRLVKQIEEEGLDKNAMEILAETGL